MSHPAHEAPRTRGERIADGFADLVGSWRFIIAQSCLLILWIAVNVLAVAFRWDPYPFILLNLCLSFQAAYTGPIILLSENRKSQRDREQAAHDYEINREALDLIRDLYAKSRPTRP